ncbi:MAG TPA: AAA family ATPase, partial [Candidatus Fournierella merdigallinarum]|nr:AAA family ATPase [Candidatus Fournierella merdigallinarum]
MQEMSMDLEALGVARPYSMEAEQSVLGAALLESETVLPELVETLRPEMFYARQNGEIFAEMVRLFTAGEQVDLVTLLDAVTAAGVFESADAAKIYLARLGETVPSLTNVGAYARIVQEKYTARQVLEAAQSILQQSGEAPSAELLLESAEQKLYQIRSGREQNSLTRLSGALVETLGNLQRITGPDKAKYAGIPTGFTYLDTILTGLGRSDLIILAARPGMGKTSFALNIATNVAKKQKVPVAIFSLEMSMEQLTNRILSAEAGVDSHAFRSGALRDSDWEDLAQASEILHDVPIYMDDTSGITIPEIKAKIRRVNQ